MSTGWPGYKGGKGKGKGCGGPEFQQIVDSYLQPLLLHSIQKTLSERSKELLLWLWQSPETIVPMRFYVSAAVGEINLIVSSADETQTLSGALDGECDEPTARVAIAGKTPVFSNSVNGCSVIFSMSGERLEQISSLPALRECQRREAKWLYTNPILEVSANLSPDAQIVGILGVEGNDERSFDIFTNNVFQREVAAMSCDVGPYLSVLSSLRQGERL